MGISSISYLSNHNRDMYRTYRSLASGKRINTASDNAAGLAIANELKNRVGGTNAGISNSKTSQNMLNVADGAIGSVTDSLQRIRELSIQASNGLYSNSDRSAIQAEIDQLKESIGGITAQTKFNEMNVLDGTMGSSHVASNADGFLELVNRRLRCDLWQFRCVGNRQSTRESQLKTQLSRRGIQRTGPQHRIQLLCGIQSDCCTEPY